jgi:hypothetical protein
MSIILSIAAVGASVLLRFTTPDVPGEYWLVSMEPGASLAKIEASGRSAGELHVAATVEAVGCRTFWVEFRPTGD